MDYDSDSSDFHFPSDTGLAKLSSPLSFKVPESRDWALDEFMQTLSEKPCIESDNLLSFKQYIPVKQDEDDDFNYGPPKLSLPTYEEKDFLTQISQHFLDLERKELHEILKGGFSLVQNDIQTNTGASPFASAHPDISWFDEAFDYGYNNTNIISNLENVEFRRNNNSFSPFEQQHHYHRRSTTTTMTLDESILSDEDEEDMIPEQEEEEEQELPELIDFIKPLPPLPTLIPVTTPPSVPVQSPVKKGLRCKLKSKLIKTFKHGDTQTTPIFLQKTKKFMRKIFPITH
ncbi:unnamed protein product [Mucor hiemalis]